MNDSMIVSFSELAKFDTCLRQYYYNFTLGFRPNELSGPITKGLKGHRLLQTFYEALAAGHTKDEAYELTHQQAKKMLNEDAKALTDGSLIIAWTLVDNYIKTTEFTAKAVLVENRFLVPVSKFSNHEELQNVQVGFTPDVVFERTGGFMDVEDSKFVGRAWSQSKIERFPQAKLYQILLSSMGYKISRSAIRFFNVTTGKVTESYKIMKRAEETILLDDFLGGVLNLVRFKRLPFEEQMKARRTLNYSTCQYCSYTFPCSLEAEGKDASKAFQYDYQKIDYDYSK